MRSGCQDHRPGQIFVATAKSLVSDSWALTRLPAPPKSASSPTKRQPAPAGHRLMAQAEHDPRRFLLFTDSPRCRQGGEAHPGAACRFHLRRHHAAALGTQSAIVLTDGHGSVPGRGTSYAAEDWRARGGTRWGLGAIRTLAPSSAVRDAGCVGDYMSGPNTLPTGGTARSPQARRAHPS